jgi:hypothetical protein
MKLASGKASGELLGSILAAARVRGQTLARRTGEDAPGEKKANARSEPPVNSQNSMEIHCAVARGVLTWLQFRESRGLMGDDVERRAARRFTMMLPLKVRFSSGDGITEKDAETRDVSFRGLYFLIEARLETGNSIEFVLTLPQQITLAGDVHIRCYANVLRVEPHNGRRGVAARIDRYEFLPALA